MNTSMKCLPLNGIRNTLEASPRRSITFYALAVKPKRGHGYWGHATWTRWKSPLTREIPPIEVWPVKPPRLKAARAPLLSQRRYSVVQLCVLRVPRTGDVT